MVEEIRVLVELRNFEEYQIVSRALVAHRSAVAPVELLGLGASAPIVRIGEALRLKPITEIKKALLEALLDGEHHGWTTFAEIATQFDAKGILPAETKVEAALREISWQMNEVFGRGEIRAISLLLEKRRSEKGQSSYQLTVDGRYAVSEFLRELNFDA